MSIVSGRQPAVSVSLFLLGVLSLSLFPLALWAKSDATGCGAQEVAAQNALYEAKVVELINQRRAEEELPPLKLVEALTNAARYHAVDMAEERYFDHATKDRIDGTLTTVCSWANRVKSFYTGYRSLGENIAWGDPSPEEVVESWMNSAGHRENVMGAYTETGVGYAQSRWVQDFGERKSEAPLIINREAIEVSAPEVTLYIHGSGEQMRLRNDDQPWQDWQPFQTEISWTLQAISGERRVEIEVQRGGSIVRGADLILLNSSTGATPTPLKPTATPVPPTPTALQPTATTTTLAPTATAIVTATAGATPIATSTGVEPTLTPIVPPTLTPTPFILPSDLTQKIYLPMVTR